MKIEAGKHNAKIKNYGIAQSKSGVPQVKVEFTLENGSTFSYFGNLGSPEQQKYTTQNLLVLGATPSNIDKVEEGLAGGVLNLDKTFELVIADHEYNGKTYTQIKFINDHSAKPAQAFIKGTNALSALKGQAAQIAAEKGLSFDKSKAVDNVGF
jgi:hypothetical protein